MKRIAICILTLTISICIQAGINHTRYLSSETGSGFTGILIGLWAQSPSGKGYADFDYFEYR